MKNLWKGIVFCTALLFSFQGFSQDTKKDTSFVKKVGKAAKKVGNETAEIAVKGASKVADKTYEGKVGPQGQTIYINKHAHYYYVGKKGQKVFISKAKLRNKPVAK
ncbi:MAG: hypothetical protein ACOH2A_03175 [Sphingobacteriaceae bacterium]